MIAETLTQKVDLLFYPDSKEFIAFSGVLESFVLEELNNHEVPERLEKYTALRLTGDGFDIVVDQMIRMGEILVNSRTRDYFRLDNGELREVESLSPKESALLDFLYVNTGRVLPLEEIFKNVWSSDLICENDNQNLRVHIKYLRDKLDPLKQFINTARSFGYYFGELDFDDLFTFCDYKISRDSGFYFDKNTKELSEENAVGKLRPLTLNLAKNFYDFRDRILPFEFLYNRVWHKSIQFKSDKNNVRVYVQYLRDAVDPGGEHIKSVRGIGYQYWP